MSGFCYRMILFSVAFAVLAASQAVALEALPVLKEGNCPSGYHTSGDYSVPGKDARFAIKKIGNCPSGYSTSGNYCVANKNAKLAIIKSGNCPNGFRTSGDYCVGN